MARCIFICMFGIALSAPAANAMTFTVTNTNDTGMGSLRQAILDANGNPGADTITFAIAPFDGTVKTVVLASDLPSVTESVAIDGYTQPGTSTNTLAQADNAVLLIELSGNDLPIGCLQFTGGISTVRGLVINRFRGHAIRLIAPAGSRLTVQGNFIGTNATGTAGLPNGRGIGLDTASSSLVGGTSPADRNIVSGNNGIGVACIGTPTVQGNFIGVDSTGANALGNSTAGVVVESATVQIGGVTAGARNVISGNRGSGIGFSGFNNIGNIFQGNFIGTDATGTKALGIQTTGIAVGGTGTIIGGSVPGAGNLISGNQGPGISGNGDMNTVIQGNLIGTDITGTHALGNHDIGVSIFSSTHTTVGGTNAGEGNVIAFNAAEGVRVFASINNPILGNSIFSNGTLGIDLENIGVTLNDPGDTDEGANHVQNFPVLTAGGSDGTTTGVTGNLNSQPNTTYRIEFFGNSAVDPSGFGEGQTFLGSTDVTTNGSGNASFNVVLPHGASNVTATATDPNGNTSEFSAPPPGQLTNISTRLEDFTGDTVLIAGFIINGVDDKTVVIRARGPSLANPPFNLAGVLPDTTVSLFSGGTMMASNDNWQDTQTAQIMSTGLAPSDPRESAIIMKLHPGTYSAIVRGVNNATGITIGEVFDVDLAANSRLVNISTRGFVGTGNNVMIGGFVVGGAGGSEKVLARAKGPSLARLAVPNVVADTTLSMFDQNGNRIGFNDNWKETQQAEIQATGLAPTNDLESAIILDLLFGSYTGIVQGKNNATGNGQIEIFELPQTGP